LKINKVFERVKNLYYLNYILLFGDIMSLLETLLYKRDAKTNELRVSKTKVISWIVFILMFIYALFFNLASPYYMNAGTLFFICFMTALIPTVIVFAIGYAIGYFLDK
jgi:cation transporter-like permease